MPTEDFKQQFNDLIETVIREGASDIHISEGKRPVLRAANSLTPLTGRPIVTKEYISSIMSIIMSEKYRSDFLAKKETDFAYVYDDRARFRGNAFFQQGEINIVMRFIPKSIKTIAELTLPPILETFSRKPQGFFLVVGPVGQGKTTTLAAMIDLINTERTEHIITVEDPIEYVFEEKRSIIDQREVHIDTESFHSALESAFRQDVDVIMVGEMRDTETIATAVTAAETGHLVFSTLHTNNASQTIDRIIDSFPGDQQGQIRLQLASVLTGIFSQRLIPRISGGLVPAYELLINNSAVANLIREKRVHEIDSVIETGSDHGMIDINRSLAELVRRGEITTENAYLYAVNPGTLDKLL